MNAKLKVMFYNFETVMTKSAALWIYDGVFSINILVCHWYS